MASDQEKNAAVHVRDDLLASFHEAIQTYGVTVALTAVVAFAATCIHETEHYVVDGRGERDDILGKWTTQFHSYLDQLNRTCDRDRALRNSNPAGTA